MTTLTTELFKKLIESPVEKCEFFYYIQDDEGEVIELHFDGKLNVNDIAIFDRVEYRLTGIQQAHLVSHINQYANRC